MEERKKQVREWRQNNDCEIVEIVVNDHSQEFWLLPDKLALLSGSLEFLIFLYPVKNQASKVRIPPQHVWMDQYLFKVEGTIHISEWETFWEELTRPGKVSHQWFIIEIDGKQVYRTTKSRAWNKRIKEILRDRKDGKIDKFKHMVTVSPAQGQTVYSFDRV